MDEALKAFHAELDTRPVSRFQWFVLFLVVLVLVVDGYGMQAASYVAPAIGAEWRLPKGAFGPVFSIGLVGYMLGAMGFSAVADRVGARRILIACVGAFGLFSLFAAATNTLPMLMAARFGAGIALGGAMPNGIALAADYAPSRMHTFMVTIAACGFSVGGALGGVVGSFLLEGWGWRSVFLVGGLAPLALAPLLVLWLPESPVRLFKKPQEAHRLRQMLDRVAPGWTAPAASPAPPGRSPSPVAGLFAKGFRAATVLIWMTFFLNLLTLYTLSSWMPSLIKAAGLPIGAANGATAAFQIAGTLGALGVALCADRFKAQWIMMGAFVLAAASVLLLAQAGPNPNLILAGASLAGIGVIGGQNAANGFASGYYPAAMRSSGIGWALGVGRLGSILGPLLVGGLIGAGVGPQTLFRLCVIPTLLAALAIALVPVSRKA